MTTDEISTATRELINRHMRSMDHAEAALYLANAPDQAHQPETVAVDHRWSRGIAKQVLADLTETGLATAAGGAYRIEPSAYTAAALAELIELYNKRPVALVRAIYAAPVRMRPLLRPTRDDESDRPGA
jgi:predicted RNase H-related nuclease YkuK (DUF458 family)